MHGTTLVMMDPTIGLRYIDKIWKRNIKTINLVAISMEA